MGLVGEPPIGRRAFVGRLPGLAALGASALLGGGCAGAGAVVPRDLGATLTLPSATVGDDGVFVLHPRDARPIFVSRDPDGALTAVHARCTHRGCQPDAMGGRLVCPCHGSEFSLDGLVMEGPASEALRRFTVSEAEGTVIIDLLGGGA